MGLREGKSISKEVNGYQMVVNECQRWSMNIRDGKWV